MNSSEQNHFICSQCQTIQPESTFGKLTKKTRVLRCRSCHRKNRRDYYNLNFDSLIKHSQKYYEKNKEKIRARNLKTYFKNHEENKQRRRQTTARRPYRITKPRITSQERSRKYYLKVKGEIYTCESCKAHYGGFNPILKINKSRHESTLKHKERASPTSLIREPPPLKPLPPGFKYKF